MHHRDICKKLYFTHREKYRIFYPVGKTPFEKVVWLLSNDIACFYDKCYMYSTWKEVMCYDNLVKCRTISDRHIYVPTKTNSDGYTIIFSTYFKTINKIG